MKNQNYFIRLDIGTDSVGYAVTDEQYNLCKFKGNAMWGVTLFDEAQLAVERRGFRAARRRLDRRQQRVQLIQTLFAREIGKLDEGFFIRIKESYLYPEKAENKVRLWHTYEKQKEYEAKYPTIHHLIVDLMENTEPHDVRLVYLACAWLVVHRGHFLSEVDKHRVDAVTDFQAVYEKLVEHVTRDNDYALPWKTDVDLDAVSNALKAKLGIQKKSTALAEALFSGAKPPKDINEQYEYNYDCVIRLLCGGKVALKDLFGKEEYAELEEKSIALNTEDEKLAAIMQSIGDDAKLIAVLKGIYDWSVLIDVLKGQDTISQAKVIVYEQHRKDLRALKYFIKKYKSDKYNEIFRSDKVKNNYVAYIGKNKTNSTDGKVKKSNDKEELCKYLLSVVKAFTPDEADTPKYNEMVARLEINDFLPKQVDGDNRVIPYQLYWHELNKILENAERYLSFIAETDEDGISGKEKILSVFEFRVPYYVGPLKEKSLPKYNHWMVRKAEGKIYPWNFNKTVDLDKSEEAFIARMTNSCTYLPAEDVLPKNSLVYCAFEVLNEINNIKINGNEISVEAKQGIYNDLFMQIGKVTPKRIREYLITNHRMSESDVLSGLDVTVKSSLKPFIQFKSLVKKELLTYTDVEAIIRRATYSEDKARFKRWLRDEYSHLPENELAYISGLKFKDFGRLSRKLLCGVEGAVDKNTGEYMSILRTMWETNFNFMQLLHSDAFDFKKHIEELVRDHYDAKPQSLSDKLEEMYISNAVKRPIIRTLDILKDIVKVRGRAPERIFIEMARGASEDQKGKRTNSRLKQILELYKKVKNEDVRELQKYLDEWGDTAHNKLQSDKLFLYFIQLGKCLYTGKSIDLNSILAGNGQYNIEHIYPRSFVKDDSVINNKILVDSKANGEKSDTYPIAPAIQEKMRGYWQYLNRITVDGSKLLSDEKFKRLTRTTGFTEEEKFEFINRQLVETRQSTKAVATLLKELYPDTEVVYVKAGLVSDFRQKFDLLKSRAVNDLHHAKDAYLNIVVGNVWHFKFSRAFWKTDAEHNAKPEIVFTHPVVRGGKTVWNGAADKDRVIRIARKNTAHMTVYSFCRKGGFFDQMPLSASEGLIPRKKNMPTEIYGGYNKTTASFFVLVKYTVAKKEDVIVMPVELLDAERFLIDEAFATAYAKKTVGKIINKDVLDVRFLLNKRILKVNTMLSLNGLKVCITGKSGGGKQLGISITEAFKTSEENEAYIKKLESFKNKKKKNSNIVYNALHDEINQDGNLSIYDCFIRKLQQAPYRYRPANPINTLLSCREKFISLACEKQVDILIDVLGLFGRLQSANLSEMGGVPKAGVATLSSTLSNWKKNYTDVRIIDQSASGLFEKSSDNLLELL